MLNNRALPAPWFPQSTKLPEAQRAAAAIEPRYEDVAQDGRVTLSALPHAIGEVVWRGRLAAHPGNRALLAAGIVPILTRMVVDASDEPVPVTRPMDASGGYDLACAVDAAGEVDRIFLDITVDVRGKRGRTHLPRGDGAEVHVGRVFAEHIFTRPWGPPEARKVRSLDDAEGYPRVPERRRVFRELSAAARLPPGATLLDDAPVLDPSPILFGLMHTDSNQHVNSLVYLRLFEEALARRHDAPHKLARWVEIGYRKPCFAGDRVRIALQAFTHGDEVGAFGAFVPEGSGKPYAYVTMGAR